MNFIIITSKIILEKLVCLNIVVHTFLNYYLRRASLVLYHDKVSLIQSLRSMLDTNCLSMLVLNTCHQARVRVPLCHILVMNESSLSPCQSNKSNPCPRPLRAAPGRGPYARCLFIYLGSPPPTGGVLLGYLIMTSM